MTLNKILKMINKNKVVVITLCLLVFIGIFLYKKNEIFKLIGYEGFENKNSEDGSETYYQEKKESTTNAEASKYAFIKEGTCISTNKEPITNGDECKIAATALGWKDFKYNAITEKFGKDRVFDTPSSEQALTALAAGAANANLRPVLIHQRLDFMIYSFDQIINLKR